jgi:hypothetical protein
MKKATGALHARKCTDLEGKNNLKYSHEIKIRKCYGVRVTFNRLPDLTITMINVYEVRLG